MGFRVWGYGGEVVGDNWRFRALGERVSGFGLRVIKYRASSLALRVLSLGFRV